MFIGVIVVAVSAAAEHSTAVLVAMKNKMDLAMNIALGAASRSPSSSLSSSPACMHPTITICTYADGRW